jgi:hypothetical protein
MAHFRIRLMFLTGQLQSAENVQYFRSRLGDNALVL